ncbi:hypothetical protein LOK49_LG06G01194 [Camellia lanceoleosa]|uniref:Uncharacterized protein n=1 Tax=Camellia lanceoleosa TaxID=1840588 RepID=A0ACC0HG13_9ERIC|nr:hypothetical protein LOK49_LG06G01194 [Camellia lanceoleosa]
MRQEKSVRGDNDKRREEKGATKGNNVNRHWRNGLGRNGVSFDCKRQRGIMVPRIKTGRRKRATSGNVLSTSEACAQEIATPMMFSDEMQPPDDTQIVVEETQPHGVGQTKSTRVRGPTLGKGMQEKIARKKGEKLHVYVNRVLNAITGENAIPTTNELGLQIRRLCPLQSMKSWKKIDQSTKDAKRSKAGKANRGMLPYNHTSGSRSFPIAMSLMVRS